MTESVKSAIASSPAAHGLGGALLRDVFARNRFVVTLSIPVVVLVCVAHHGKAPVSGIFGWLVFMLMIQAVRVLISHGYIARNMEGRSPALWRGSLQFSVLIAGLGWGAMLFMLDSRGEDSLLTLRFLVLTAVLGISLNSLSAIFPAYATFVVSIAAMVGAFLFDPSSMLDGAIRLPLASGSAIYLTCLLVIGLHANKLTASYFVRQLEREDALARLRTASEKEGELRRQLLEKSSKLEESNIRLQHMARNDALTGIPNRRHLMEQLERSIKNAERHPGIFSVILLDIDHFKSINDTHGHLVGDRVLIAFAAQIATHLREMDIVGRWGGEEFLCLLPNTPFEEAVVCAERLRLALDTTELIGECAELIVSASFGVTTYQPGEPLNALIGRVDTLLYTAKSAGRNCVSGQADAIPA